MKYIIKTLYEASKQSFKTGGWKYGLGNLSCELRRGRYPYHKPNRDDQFLFSFGVFLLDPTGFGSTKLFASPAYKHIRSITGRWDQFSDEQYLHHPWPWVRKRWMKVKQQSTYLT